MAYPPNPNLNSVYYTGAGGSTSNTSATATLTLSIGAQTSNSYPLNYYVVVGVSIYTASVTVSSITQTSGVGIKPFTFQAGATDPVSGVRAEVWTGMLAGDSNNAPTLTVNFSSNALGAAVWDTFIEPIDFPSVPLVNNVKSTYNSAPPWTSAQLPSVVSGNLITVAYSNGGTSLTGYGITDTLGTSYSLIQTNVGSNAGAYMWAGSATKSGPCTVTITATNGSLSGSIIVSQWAGVTATVDAHNGTGGGSAGVVVSTVSSNISTSFAHDLLYAIVAPDGQTGTAGGGWANFANTLSSAGTPALTDQAMVTSSTGSYTATFLTTNVGYYSLIAAFELSNPYYSPVSPSPATASNYGVGYNMECDLTPTQGGSLSLTVFSVATLSGDSIGAPDQSIRAVVPTVTSAACAMVWGVPSSSLSPLRTTATISNSTRHWVAVSFELIAGNPSGFTPDAGHPLQSGLTTQTEKTYSLKSPNTTQTEHVPNSGSSVLAFFGSVLGSGYVSVPYSETLTATGGVSPYTFALISGSLPTGLILNSLGTISGVPTVAGAYNFTVRLTDSSGGTTTHAFTIVITSPYAGGSNYGIAY